MSRRIKGLLFALVLLWVVGCISLQALAVSADLQNRINTLISQGKYGAVLQDLVMQRAGGIAPWNRPYSYDGIGDCYGFCRQVWNAILYDGSAHSEDFYPNYYQKDRWHYITGGIPVNTYADPDWVYINSYDELLPGDLLATHQGHTWGSSWHGGIYAGKVNGVHYDYDCYYPDGAYKRQIYTGFHWYYKPLHDLLAMQNQVARPAGGMNTDGRLEVFMRAKDGLVYHTWQDSVNGNWSAWYQFSGTTKGNPVVISEASGALVVYTRGNSNDILLRKQSDGWAQWYSLGGVTYYDPAVGKNQDGRLEVFHVGTTGRVYKKYQTTPNGGYTSSFDDMGGSTNHTPTVINNQDDRQEIFIRWSSDGVAHKWQNYANGDWFTEWDGSLGGGVKEEPFAFQADSFDSGRVYLFVRGTDNNVYYKYQAEPNGGWVADWSYLGGVQSLSRPVAALNTNGTLMVFIRGTDYAIWSNRYTPGTGWSGWSSHGGIKTSDPLVIRYQDGRLAIIARGNNGRMYIRKQTAANSVYWTNWEILGDDVDRF